MLRMWRLGVVVVAAAAAAVVVVVVVRDFLFVCFWLFLLLWLLRFHQRGETQYFYCNSVQLDVKKWA